MNRKDVSPGRFGVILTDRETRLVLISASFFANTVASGNVIQGCFLQLSPAA
jgi:hypothetical protein